MSRQGKEDPEGQRQGKMYRTMAQLWSGSDMQQVTFSAKLALFPACPKLLEIRDSHTQVQY